MSSASPRSAPAVALPASDSDEVVRLRKKNAELLKEKSERARVSLEAAVGPRVAEELVRLRKHNADLLAEVKLAKEKKRVALEAAEDAKERAAAIARTNRQLVDELRSRLGLDLYAHGGLEAAVYVQRREQLATQETRRVALERWARLFLIGRPNATTPEALALLTTLLVADTRVIVTPAGTVEGCRESLGRIVESGLLRCDAEPAGAGGARW